MHDSQTKTSMVIRTSPIEFVVTGPKNKRDGVLVRSEDARMDLIGFAASQGIKPKPDSISILRLIFFPSRRMCSVDSYPLDRSNDEWDKRWAEYQLYWVGLCSGEAHEEIRTVFNQYVADVQAGIEEGDIEQVEWSLAPVVVSCLEANERYARLRRMSLALSVMYALIGLGVALILQIYL